MKTDECLPALRALSDPTRLKIVERLLTGDHNVNELAEHLGTPQYNVSKHVRVLREAGIVAVAVMTAIGALADGRNVAETIAKKVTDMNPGEGFAANVATALLVSTASYHSLPVSTTHVSVGSLLGIGIVTRKAHWPSVGQIVLSWLVTLPCGAVLAALAVFAIGHF